MNSNEQEARYIIVAGAAQQIVNYLQQRPYAEVVGLIDIFRRLEMLPVEHNGRIPEQEYVAEQEPLS